MITKLFHKTCALFFAGLLIAPATAQTGKSPEEAAIRQILEVQTAAWNKGDLKTFVSYYSPEVTFMGEVVTRGTSQLLARYQQRYSNPDKMGTLTFKDIEVQLLGMEHALVLGKYHLARNAAGGGPADGKYSLVLKKTKSGWHILHDHTS